MTNAIVYYHFEEITLECRVYDTAICIKDSHLITDDDNKKYVIDDLLNNFEWYKESRTAQDMFYEWKTHNILYEWNILKERTKDTDIELKQNRFIKFCYKVFAKIFKEKK